MNRRQLLAAVGALTGGGAVVTGTGAFTSVSANRDLSVQVAGDDAAFLRIDDTGNENAAYVTETGGEFGIDITGGNPTDAGGEGVNANATTVIEDLFEVQNQGTQEIEVRVTPLSFVDIDGADTLIVLVVPKTSFPSVTLGVGDSETYSLVVDSFPDGTDLDVSDSITITGEAT
jgi:hypothetical protein